MAREGWAFRISPVGASQMPGYSDPIATKNENGDIIFLYDAQVVHYGMLGHWTGPHKVVGMERLTNVVAVASLRPVTNFWRLSSGTPTYPVASRDTSGIASGVLPVLDYDISSDGQVTYPSRECVLWVGDWVWYVPPQHDGDIPMAAVVSTDTTRTPGYAYPIRVVLFPVLLVADILYWPVVFIASGGHPVI